MKKANGKAKAKGKAKPKAVRMRPAGATDDGGADESSNWQIVARNAKARRTNGVPAKFDPETPEGQRAPEGEQDQRQTSMAQRHVFKMSRASIPQELVERYDFLKSKECDIRGKERMANEIINAVVPRDAGYGSSIKPDRMTLSRIVTKEKTNKDKQVCTSMRKRIMIKTIFHGDERDFEAAKLDGDAWSDPEEPGKYVYDASVKETIKKNTSKRTAQEEFDVKDQTKFRAGMAQLMLEELEPPTWKPEKTTGRAARKALEDDMADATDFQLLQNCNDAMTTVTLALKRMGPEVMKCASSDVSRKLAKDTMQLLKSAVAPSEKVTELLMSGIGQVNELHAEGALISAGKCYEDLHAIHAQCRNVIKIEKNKASSSAASQKGNIKVNKKLKQN